MAPRPAASGAAKNTPPRSPPPPSSSSSSWVLFLLLPALATLVGVVLTRPDALALLQTHEAAVNTTMAPVAPLMDASTATTKLQQRTGIPDKYASELVQINTRKLLAEPADAASCPPLEVLGDLTHVVDAVDALQAAQTTDDRVFLMLNGQDDGVFVRYPRSQHDEADDGCLFPLARLVTQTLGADAHAADNGMRLFSQDGEPVTSSRQLRALRVAHVLLDFQLWVWPGVRVGHKRTIDGAFNVTTQSLHPKVFTVEGFFSQAEADAIVAEGLERLSRSPVDSPDAVDGYHADRTSFTAFLDDSAFTRDLRVRTSRLLRLPSPGFTERMQLVRYETGQFFRQHEDYFDSKQFLPTQQLAASEYEAWAKWAAAALDALALDEDAEQQPPAEFRRGGNLFPVAEDKTGFQQALLAGFMEDARASDFFFEHADVAWGNWIAENLEHQATDILGPLLRDRGYMLPHIIKSWEARAGNLRALKYAIPPREVSGVTHYFRWLRWVKERIQDLLDDGKRVPDEIKPMGKLYPTYHMSYQNELVALMLEEVGEQELADTFGHEWVGWLKANRRNTDVLLEALRGDARVFDAVVRAWSRRVGAAGGDEKDFAYDKPAHARHFEPNRFATVFLYLNDCPEGGETVFPYSRERIVTGIEREGMHECSEGLAVPPTRLTASMFYSQTPDNAPDPASLHGGCPPAKGVKCKD